jgi:hypothetical protein
MAATDSFAALVKGLDAPADDDINIDTEKHDTNELSKVPRSVYVGVAGDIKMQLLKSSAPRTWTAVPAGTILPVRPKQVWSTGTTATGLIGIL